jgi:hypothetical protein
MSRYTHVVILIYSFRSPSLFYLLTVGVDVVYFHFITLRHTSQSVGPLWTSDRPVAETSTWQHTHSQQTNIHARAGIRPTIPASARPQTYALDGAAAGISDTLLLQVKIKAVTVYKPKHTVTNLIILQTAHNINAEDRKHYSL